MRGLARRRIARVVGCVLAPLALAAGVACAQATPGSPEVSSGWTTKSPVSSRHFMVAAANPLATRAGYDTLR
ncbi:MAG TPA: gamma-glutamyltransferase, partial [Actinomycetota bacterium]|nr:gamma-glutamyltransferase [Actinomycetota bacterium]